MTFSTPFGRYWEQWSLFRLIPHPQRFSKDYIRCVKDLLVRRPLCLMFQSLERINWCTASNIPEQKQGEMQLKSNLLFAWWSMWSHRGTATSPHEGSDGNTKSDGHWWSPPIHRVYQLLKQIAIPFGWGGQCLRRNEIGWCWTGIQGPNKSEMATAEAICTGSMRERTNASNTIEKGLEAANPSQWPTSERTHVKVW